MFKLVVAVEAKEVVDNHMSILMETDRLPMEMVVEQETVITKLVVAVDHLIVS